MKIFANGNKGLIAYNLSDKNVISFEKKLAADSKFFVLSTDGKYVAYATRNHHAVVVDMTSLNEVVRIQLSRSIQGISFSPKCGFVSIMVQYLCKGGEQPEPNLMIYKIGSTEASASFVQKKQIGWEPLWFSDESYLVRCLTNNIYLHEPSDLTKFVKKIHIERVDEIALSPNAKKKYFAAYVPPSGKGQPAACRIYCIDTPDAPIAQKSFFKCDKVSFKWNPKGTDLLILASNEVDKTNASYYGDQTLHYANLKGDSCIVQLKKSGPIYSVQWNTDTFCVVYGFMPAKATLFNLKCDPILEFGEGPRNSAYFNKPHGNILLLGGFGNLPGNIEAWDLEAKKIICNMKAADTTYLEFSADGEHFLTATCAPRLRVNNGFKVWHYTGALKSEIAADKDCENGFEELWHSKFSTFADGTFPKPQIVYKKVEGIQPSQPKASNKAYVPPSLRAQVAEKKIEEDKKKAANKKKEKKAKAEAAVVAAPATPVVPPQDDEKRARALKKKLSQIYVLKNRLSAGETLEPEQLAKINTEKELSEELKRLEL